MGEALGHMKELGNEDSLFDYAMRGIYHDKGDGNPSWFTFSPWIPHRTAKAELGIPKDEGEHLFFNSLQDVKNFFTAKNLPKAALALPAAASMYSPQEAGARQVQDLKTNDKPLEEAVNPAEYMIPGRFGGGVLNAGIAQLMKSMGL